MEIVVHDNTLKTVAVINNDIPMLPSFFNDNWHRYKDQGAETFIFTVNKFINGQLQDYCRFLNEQAYISFTYDGIDHLFGVENVQESDYQITLTCSSLNLELRNEQANALVNTSSHNIQWYFDQMGLIENAQITIGTNEVSGLTRTINYDGQESKLARLISVIGNFDAEFEFITHLNDDGTLDSIILNIYRANDGANAQGVGTNRNDVSLNFGKNISGITRTGDTTNLFNATTVTGSDNLNWNSSSFSYQNEDGVEEFYKRAGSDTAYAPLSLNLFKSQIKSNNGDKWIRKDFQTEYTNVNDMWGYCVSQFKQFAYPTVTYEVLANSSLVLESVGNDRPLSIGDTINIQDDNFMDSDGNVGLLLSARVSEMEISFSNPTLNKITFSNFKKQQSEASTDIQAIVNQLVDEATPYIGSIDTTNGTQFKNGTGSTTLSAHIFKGSATTETIADSYEWSKDGTVVAPTQTITVDASGVADKAVYSFKATVGGKVVASQSVTITNVNDGKGGADGKTSYTHVAWANNITGTDGFTTVYPNLNLGDNTKTFVGAEGGNNLSGSIRIDPATQKTQDGDFNYLTYKPTRDNSDWFRFFLIPDPATPNMTKVTVKPNTKYTFSVLLKGTGQHTIYAYNSWTAPNTPWSLQINLTSDWKLYTFTVTSKDVIPNNPVQFFIRSNNGTEINLKKPKVEQGSTATPYMPSSSEVTTADWPNYIGQYSDFTATTSTDPAKYAPWTVFKGNDGVGIKTTVITYAISTNGTTAPTTGWTSSVPSLVKGQYLWTKTVWAYTDNSSETGYSVTYISKDGNNGNDGIAGKDGVGILTTTITYAGSTSGTTAPTSGWTTTVPTVAAGSYLWTKTVWGYTDNTSETGYSVAKMGNNGATGPQGPAGSNGDPGKIVSDTEPTTRFKGLTWKYSGTTDLTASDGTVIHPNTEYYYNGTHWVINYFSVNNFAAESITSDKIDGKNLTITDGEFVSTTTNGPVTTSTEIKDNHIAISKTDGTVNTRNDIALDSEQGLAQKFTNINTGFYRTAGINYQGPFTSDSDGNFAQLTPQGTKLSTDVPWTTLAATGGFSGSIQFAIQNGIAFFSLTQVLTPKMTAETWYQIAQLPSGSKAIPSINRVMTAFANTAVWGFYVSTNGGLYLQSKAALNTAGSTSANTIASFPIG